MRVGIDGYNLAMPHGTGISTYASELVEALHGLNHDVLGIFGLEVPAAIPLRQAAFFDRYRRSAQRQRASQWWLQPLVLGWRQARAFAPHPAREVPVDGNVVIAADGTAAIPAFDQLVTVSRLFDDAMLAFARTGRFATLRLRKPPDVMHWTYPLPVRVAGARNVYTLHDLVPLKLPYATLDNKKLYGRLVAGCLHAADQVCTVSEASKRDIVERFGVDPARITNTFQTAPAPSALAADPTGDARAIEGIFGLEHRGYFLFFGSIEPKKNVGRLIEAHLALQTRTPLVIVGAKAWQSEEELRLLPGDGTSGATGTFRGPRGQTIIRLDYLPRDLLSRLIRGARAVVFPSLYEGFGLPVLEAMQLGTAVITSLTSSLPELVGDAGLMVDPYDVRALMEAMHCLDVKPEVRRTLAARGIERARLFSRERYQERLTQLYSAAMAPR